MFSAIDAKEFSKLKRLQIIKSHIKRTVLKNDGGIGLVTKKAEICSDCNMDFEDFMCNKPVAGRDTNDR